MVKQEYNYDVIHEIILYLRDKLLIKIDTKIAEDYFKGFPKCLKN